ncbi:MAG: CPBP family intramembrane metalloprotease [Capnocytophaga sp.]|nr:CPBP family intramembrane metalloprotease [Capnocytophaga sp.]
MKKIRAIEFFFLYIVVPLLLFFFREQLKAQMGGGSFVILFLPIIAPLLVTILLREKTIQWCELWSVANFKYHFIQILKIFLPFSLVITIATYYFFSDLFLILPKMSIGLWIIVMLFYPLLSVLPQGIIYRVFFYKRYAMIFKQTNLLWISALSFCFCHIFFNNIYALIFTFLGGFLFSFRYEKTNSWLISSLEHAMYGNLLFTIGLGTFLVS